MPKPNYQREKRLRDLERQRKQEEKRQKKAAKAQGESGMTEEPASADMSGPEGQPGAGTAFEPESV